MQHRGVVNCGRSANGDREIGAEVARKCSATGCTGKQDGGSVKARCTSSVTLRREKRMCAKAYPHKSSANVHTLHKQLSVNILCGAFTQILFISCILFIYRPVDELLLML